jgi:hypothetical protein
MPAKYIDAARGFRLRYYARRDLNVGDSWGRPKRWLPHGGDSVSCFVTKNCLFKKKSLFLDCHFFLILCKKHLGKTAINAALISGGSDGDV